MDAARDDPRTANVSVLYRVGFMHTKPQISKNRGMQDAECTSRDRMTGAPPLKGSPAAAGRTLAKHPSFWLGF